MVPLVLVDATFLCANLLKIVDGAWAPLALGAAIVLLVLTWRRGTTLLLLKTRLNEVPFDALVANLEKRPPHVVPGTAIFLTSDPSSAPTALLHNLKHNRILHEHNVILTIKTADTPRVPDDERVRMTQVSPHFAKVEIVFGFMETPNIPRASGRAQAGVAFRYHVDVILPVATRAQAGRAVRHAALAGPPVYRACQIGQRCDGFLSNPDRAGGRDRDATDHLSQYFLMRNASANRFASLSETTG